MDQEQLIRQIMEQVMADLGNDSPSFQKNVSPRSSQEDTKAPASSNKTLSVTKEQYPLAEKIPEKIDSNSGKMLSEYTFEKVLDGDLTSDDFRISPDVLEMQASVADSVARPQFAANLRRAAELVRVPDAEVLAMYDALRPYRKSKAELYELADNLDNKYGATQCATFMREAADVYEKRGRLRPED